MVTIQIVQGHTGLAHRFDIWARLHSSLSARVPQCQKLKNGLDLYGAERFGRLIFATIRKSVGDWKG